jgi:hypothetical protein
MVTMLHIFVDFTAMLWKFCSKSGFGKKQSAQDHIKDHSGHPKSSPASEKPLILGPFLETFQFYFRLFFSTFFDALQDCHFSDLGAKPAPKRMLLRDIFMTFWGEAGHVKIVLSCGFWLGSEGWRLSQSRQFSEVFRGCL